MTMTSSNGSGRDYSRGVDFHWSVPVYEDEDGYMYTTIYYYDDEWRSVNFPEECTKDRIVESIKKDFDELIRERNIDDAIKIMDQAFLDNGKLNPVIIDELNYYNLI